MGLGVREPKSLMVRFLFKGASQEQGSPRSELAVGVCCMEEKQSATICLLRSLMEVKTPQFQELKCPSANQEFKLNVPKS